MIKILFRVTVSDSKKTLTSSVDIISGEPKITTIDDGIIVDVGSIYTNWCYLSYGNYPFIFTPTD